MKNHDEIEPKIKPLVEILNQIPYISTNQSCEGHYDSLDYDEYRAYVGFNVKDEKCFMNLLEMIIKGTYESAESVVAVNKTFYPSFNGGIKINEQWFIEIKPFNHVPGHMEQTREEKRKSTDEMIKKIAGIVGEYLEKSR
jgi:hypothetical protein